MIIGQYLGYIHLEKKGYFWAVVDFCRFTHDFEHDIV